MRASTLSRARFGIGGAAALSAMAYGGAPAAAAQYEWKFGTDYGADHPIGIRGKEACAKIYRDTGGRMRITPYFNAELGGAVAMLTQLRSGALELLGTAGAGLLESIAPAAGIDGVAFAFKDVGTAFAAFDGDLGTIVRDAIGAKGIVVLDKVWDQGFRIIMTWNRPIRNVADIAGVKIRTAPSKLRLDTFRALGASPTVVSSPETYAALQTHLVDGSETSLVTMAALRWTEVQKYCSLTNHMWGASWIVANEDKWKALPPDIRTVVSTHLNAAAIAERRDFELLTNALQDKLSREGIVFNAPDRESFRAKLIANGYYDRWRNEFGAQTWSALEKYTGHLGG